MTFQACAEAYIAAHQAGWRNPKHRAQWSAAAATYAYPIFGSLPVQAVDVAFVMKALEPIWTEKPETAIRVRGRIESVLDWATAREYRQGENPARWRGHLENLLPKKSKVRRVEHHAAIAYPRWRISCPSCARSTGSRRVHSNLRFNHLSHRRGHRRHLVGNRFRESPVDDLSRAHEGQGASIGCRLASRQRTC